MRMPSRGIAGFGMLQVFAALTVATLTTFTPSESRARYLSSSDPKMPGMLCVMVSKADLPRVLRSLRGSRISTAEGDEDLNVHCYGDGLAISVPEGLERPALEKLRKAGFNARTGLGTAGGSGYIKQLISETELSPIPISDETLALAKADMECKLRTVALRNFKYASVYPCKGPQFPGLCWDIRVLGHTAVSDGLRPADLNGTITDKYWVRAFLEIWMGRFDDLSDLETKRTQKDKLLVFMSVYQSEYARAPDTAIPEKASFHQIDAFEPSIEPNDLDELLNDNIAKKFFSSRLACEK